MPEWVRLLSSVALLTGMVLVGWALLAAVIRRRAMLAPDDQSEGVADERGE